MFTNNVELILFRMSYIHNSILCTQRHTVNNNQSNYQMKFEYLLCLLFIVSSASSVSDVRMKLMKEFITNPNSLRFETTMSTNPQSIVNLYD